MRRFIPFQGFWNEFPEWANTSFHGKDGKLVSLVWYISVNQVTHCHPISSFLNTNRLSGPIPDTLGDLPLVYLYGWTLWKYLVTFILNERIFNVHLNRPISLIPLSHPLPLPFLLKLLFAVRWMTTSSLDPFPRSYKTWQRSIICCPFLLSKTLIWSNFQVFARESIIGTHPVQNRGYTQTATDVMRDVNGRDREKRKKYG